MYTLLPHCSDTNILKLALADGAMLACQAAASSPTELCFCQGSFPFRQGWMEGRLGCLQLKTQVYSLAQERVYPYATGMSRGQGSKCQSLVTRS